MMSQDNGEGCLGCAKGVVLLFLLPFIMTIAGVFVNVANGVGVFLTTLMQVLLFLLVVGVLVLVCFGGYFLFLNLMDYKHEMDLRQRQRGLTELPQPKQRNTNILPQNPTSNNTTPTIIEKPTILPNSFTAFNNYKQWEKNLNDTEKQKDKDFEG